MTEQIDQNSDKPPELPPEVNKLLDKLVAGYQKPADILGENGLLKQLTKALVERALEAEMTHHLGYSKYAPDGKNSGNSRNGREPKSFSTSSAHACSLRGFVSTAAGRRCGVPGIR